MSTEPTKKLKVTPGKVHVEHGCIYFLNNGTPPQNRAYIRCTQGRDDNGDWISMDECDGNLTLYADAHNTYNKTFLLPSELADQLEEARDMLYEAAGYADDVTDSEGAVEFAKRARAFLSRTSPTDPTPPEK